MLQACFEYKDIECIKSLLLMIFTLYKQDRSKPETKNIYVQEEL